MVAGHVAAHEFPALSPYCAFWAAAGSEVRSLVPMEKCVVSVCEKTVRVHGRTGMPRATFTPNDKTGEFFAATMVQPGQIALGGISPTLLLYDAESNRLALQVGIKAGCTVLQSYRNAVYGGQMDGTVAVLDPRAFRSTTSLPSGFSGGIQALDVKDKLLCCSGYTMVSGTNGERRDCVLFIVYC